MAHRPAWGAKPVPLGDGSGIRTLSGPEAATDFAPAVAELLASTGGRRADNTTGLRGRSGAGRRAEVLGALPGRSQRIVLLSAEGGTGRSVLAGGLALAIARHRTWPVAVVDAAQDPNSALPARLGLRTGPTILDVLPLLGKVTAGTQLGQYVRQLPVTALDRTAAEGHAGGVHLFASPGPGERQLAIPETDMLLRRLAELYPTVLVDCAAGISHPLHRTALGGASSVVMVARARADDLRRAAGALDLLRGSTLVAPVIGAIVAARPGRWSRPAAAAEPVFGAACAATLRVPWDMSLAESAPVTEVGPAAATAFAELAAMAIAASPPRRARRGRNP